MKRTLIISMPIILIACQNRLEEQSRLQISKDTLKIPEVSLVVLGTVQDAGSPHAGCNKECCRNLFENPDPRRQVVSLGVFDRENNQKYLFEATPDLPLQMKTLKIYGLESEKETPDGIFLTHAHIGHYTGLMYLGKESMNADHVPVYAMPRMKEFLETNGPWRQLVSLDNIQLALLQNEEPVELSENLDVTPILVPHRDEISETVGYLIEGPNKRALFIPDIDKWEKWDKDIVEMIGMVDYAFLDASFYSGEEIGHRNISEIPHPFIIESMKLFDKLDEAQRQKVVLIHFNHTNPMLNENSEENKRVLNKGFRIARRGDVFEM